jgi:hypothetical protein
VVATVSVWDAYTNLRLQTIIFTKIVCVLMIRTSGDNSTAVVYGIN